MKYLVLILMLMLVPTILATDIDKTSVTIEITNNSILFRTTDFGNINDKNFSIEIINGSIIPKTYPQFDLIFERNTTISNLDFINEYLICLSEKSNCEIDLGKFDRAWTECLLDLEGYEGENSTICQIDLNDCNLRVKEKDLTIGSKQDKIETLETESEDKKQVKYIYLVAGLVIGGFAIAYKYGKIGGGVKESSSDDFNPSQAG